jgi:hypothetical protein
VKDILSARRMVAAAATAAAVAVGTAACGPAVTQAEAAHTWSGGTAGAGAGAAAGAAVVAPASPGASSSGTSKAGSRTSPSASAKQSAAAGNTPAATTGPTATAGSTPTAESTPTAGPAATTGGTAPTQQAAPAAVQRGLLREFLTVKDAGYFYTAFTPEAASAVSTFHFQPTGATFGYLDATQAAGTIPLYRLHDVGTQAYLVTSYVSEKDSLLASGSFTLDGVLGYIAANPVTGTFAIWRVSKGPQPYWRLATTAQEQTLVSQGWRLDGLVGYMWPKA